MTPEQLDEIANRQAAAMWIGGPTAAFAQDTLALIKALREARAEADTAKAFHAVAVKERDYERAVNSHLRAALERIANPAAIGSAFHEEAVAIARRVL